MPVDTEMADGYRQHRVGLSLVHTDWAWAPYHMVLTGSCPHRVRLGPVHTKCLEMGSVRVGLSLVHTKWALVNNTKSRPTPARVGLVDTNWAHTTQSGP